MKKRLNSFLIDLSRILALTALLFVVINLLSLGVLKYQQWNYKQKGPRMVQLFGEKILKEAAEKSYGGISYQELLDLYHDFDTLPQEYAPYTMREEQKGYKSKNINIAQEGHRIGKHQAKLGEAGRDPIYLFGGSLLFGHHVSDSDTIGSFLQEELGSNYGVFNFGSVAHQSRQNLSRMIKILVEHKIKPKMIIFANGLEMEDESYKVIVKESLNYQLYTRTKLSSILPILKLIEQNSDGLQKLFPSSKEDLEMTGEQSFSRYQRIIEVAAQICKAHGIEFRAFVLPSSSDMGAHSLFFQRGVPKKTRHQMEVSLAADQYFKKKDDELPLFDLRSLIKRSEEEQFIDYVHYSPQFSKVIAREISRRLLP